MKQSRALRVSSIGSLSNRDKTAAVFTLVAAVLPFTLHMLPGLAGSPIGMKLIPLFYAPLIASLFFRLPVALFIGVLGPFMNFFIFGRPQIGMVLQLALEMVLFVCLIHAMKSKLGIRWVAAPFALLGAKFASWLLFFGLAWGMATPQPMYFVQVFTLALPGIAILWGMNISLISYQNHHRHASEG